jgi:hypothetical protein
MADDKSLPIFVAVFKDGSVRLIRAAKRSTVEERLLADFEIRKATQDDLVSAVGSGVKVEQA